MSTDYYLRIDGIKGESTVTNIRGFKEPIELLSWSWGASNPAHRLGDHRVRDGAGGAHRAAVLGPHVDSLELPVRVLRDGQARQ